MAPRWRRRCIWWRRKALSWYSAIHPANRRSIGFADFRGGQNARLQSFFYFTSGPEEQFGPDLALLVSLVADKSLTPQTGPERSWRELAQVAEELRDRKLGGKAVFRVEA